MLGTNPMAEIVAAQTTSRKHLVLACLGTGSLINGINSSAVIAVLPVIAASLHTNLGAISWVLMANLITLTSLLLVFGRLADLVGPRHVFLAGLASQAVGAVVAACAPNELVLVLAAVIQGIGSGLVVSGGMLLVTRTFGEAQRGKGIGLLVAITYAGLVVGPALGGLITAAVGWRAIYLLVVPVAAAGLLAGTRLLPQDAAANSESRFDFKGAAASAAGLTFLLLALNRGSEWGWASMPVLGSFIAAAVLMGVFIWVEQTRAQPMLDLQVFHDRLFTAAVCSSILNYVAAFFETLLLPYYLLQGRGFDTATSGLLLMVPGLAMLVVTPQAGKLSDRIGSRLLASGGLGISGIGLTALALLNEDSSLITIVVAEIIAGLGAGLFSSPNTSAIMGEAPPEHRGTAAGIQAMARNLGMVLGIALAGALLNQRLNWYGAAAFMPAFRDTLLVGAAIALAGAGISLTRGHTTHPGMAGQPRHGQVAA